MFQLQHVWGKDVGGVVLSWVKLKVCCWGRLIGWWGGQMLWALHCTSERLSGFDEDVSAVIQEASTWWIWPAVIQKHKYWWGTLSLRAKDTKKPPNVRFLLSSWIFAAEFINVTADASLWKAKSQNRKGWDERHYVLFMYFHKFINPGLELC